MRRFYLPPEQCRTETLTLTGAEAHHAADVLRVRMGESVAVLDGAGRELTCAVTQVERKQIRLRVEETAVSPPPPCRLTLVQAVPKGKIFDTILQKATELGAWGIIPLLSERVVTQLEGESASAKGAKWRQIAIEAIKQCGQRWLPKVEEPQHLPEALKRAGEMAFDLTLVGSLQGHARHPREYFLEFEKQRQRRPASVALWIGPEGDFAPAELDAIRHSGALPISLGPLVLRSETAALYALSVINYEMMWNFR